MTEAELLDQSDDDYMNDGQRAFFRARLMDLRRELQAHISDELEVLREPKPSNDPSDIARTEEQWQWQLRLLEREKKYLEKIDDALQRLVCGEYGWCRETGEPIGLKRLLLLPTTSLCIDAKQREELRERHKRAF